MPYLYGDSTASPLQIDYLDFLDDALDFSVAVLSGVDRLRQARERLRTVSIESDAHIAALDRLIAPVAQALDPALGGPDSPVTRCAADIVRMSGELVKAEIARVTAGLSNQGAQLDSLLLRERAGWQAALGKLLVKHDLPGTVATLHLRAQGELRYLAELDMSTAFGLRAVMALEIPQNHTFAQLLRVERLVERLDVQAPELGGWIRKEVTLQQQRLARHYIVEIEGLLRETVIKLRQTPQPGSPGFDIVVRTEAPRVQLIRQGEGPGQPESAYQVTDEGDQQRLLAFTQQVMQEVIELAGLRGRLVQARFDDAPLAELETTLPLVERLVAVMAPTVQEIAQRSQNPAELVLRRQVGGNRREEIFLSRADLLRKLAVLPDDLQQLFAPFGLGGTAAVAADRPPAESPRFSAAQTASLDRLTTSLFGELVAAGGPARPMASSSAVSTSGTVEVSGVVEIEESLRVVVDEAGVSGRRSVAAPARPPEIQASPGGAEASSSEPAADPAAAAAPDRPPGRPA
jgi:hypothetical protein